MTTARRTLLMVAAVALAAGLLASCAGDDGGPTASGAGSDATARGDVTTTTAGTTTTRGPTGSGQPVTLAFAGDTNFQDQLGAVRSSPGSVLGAIAPTLSAADLTMVNLEAALGTGGSPQPKDFTFHVPEQAVAALQAAGVDVVTMANNHGMDFGPAGLQDSLRIKRAGGLPILGIGGDDAEAYTPWITEVKGQRIGFVAANDVFDAALTGAWTAGPGHPGLASAEEAHQARLAQEVQALRPQVDTLVVFLHWGTERQTCPNPRQKELADLLVGAGADIVVGSHPHRLQGVGYDGQQFVAYSLGNFAFKANSPEGAATGVLTVTATGRRIDGYTWTPAVIRGSIPYPLTGAAADAAQATMAQRQACAGLTPAATP
ncbi:CapA family protein [Dermatobacter hominis]|uniref:CapA family protein n=1 Tax=Dermatobacter hominis TaxID=2884263 RepID=UPI001D11689C|nr:CapA family protein [Dermatobacter hominis]UDY36484.1 CapA family protein [Dermatobacter hominis]